MTHLEELLAELNVKFMRGPVAAKPAAPPPTSKLSFGQKMPGSVQMKTQQMHHPSKGGKLSGAAAFKYKQQPTEKWNSPGVKLRRPTEDTDGRLGELLDMLRQDEGCKSKQRKGDKGRMAEAVANPQWFADDEASGKAAQKVLDALLSWGFKNPARGLEGEFHPGGYRMSGGDKFSRASGTFDAKTKEAGEKFYKALLAWAKSHGMEESPWRSDIRKPTDFIRGQIFYVKGAPKHHPLLVWQADDPYQESAMVVGYKFYGRG